MEENKSVDFELLEHQKEAVQGVDEIYANGNRFAGVKLPTGGGKSFVAMMEILKAGGNDYLSKTNDGVINDASIMFIAPTNEILFQMQSNIAEFILKKDVNKMDKDEIILAVKKAFPNLSLKCYQTLISESKKENLKQKDPDLIIFDEAHKSGAKESQSAIIELLGCRIEKGEPKYRINSTKRSKVLAISATPERDVDGKNMMDLWAEAIDNLKPEQIEKKEHLGMDLDLDTAVRKGIVVEQEVIHFNANLVHTPDYKRLVNLYEQATGKIKESLRKRLDEINEDVIGIPGYDTLPEEKQKEAIEKKNLEVIIKAIKDGKIEKGGKMILFIPPNREKNGEKTEDPEFFKQKKEFIEKMLKDSGLKIDVSVLSSYYSNNENETTLNNFNKPVEGDCDFKIIMACQKLNEGIHAKGITCSFMERNISEGENTNQRAQTILFLQQIGRTVFSIIPGQEPKKRPVIFDYVNNFYTQNRDNPRKDKIEIFQLTEPQAKLLNAVRMADLETYKSTDSIQNRLPRLLDILRILREYRFGPDNDIEFVPTNEMIEPKMTLEKLLDKLPLSEKKEEILQRLEAECLYSPEKKYYIGIDFYDAKEAFWKGAKCFKDCDLNEIIDSGIIDTKSNQGRLELLKYVNKQYIDLKTGFIKMGPINKFINLNIHTGNEYSLEGKDIEGFLPGQFDQETGKDSNGYNRFGFNDEGIHKDTNTIHDSHGFMANGVNILTGKDVDLLNYDRFGIKSVENEKGIVIGGWDRDGIWHLKNEDGTWGPSISEYSEGYEPKQDVHGFTPPPKRKHVETKLNTDYKGFHADGRSSNQLNHYRNKEGYDIDGFDENGFDVRGIHKNGTRLDDKGKTVQAYSKDSMIIKEKLKNLSPEKKQKYLDLYPDGKFHSKGKDGSDIVRIYNINNFDGDGTNRFTGNSKDIYGFTILDYKTKEELQKTNEFFYKPKDVPRVVAGKQISEFYENGYNILGTDRNGKMKNGERHPSLTVTADYIQKCMKNGMSLEDFSIEYAISNKMLVPEAKLEIRKSLMQATTLYRICPEIQKTSESAKEFYSAEPEKVQEFFRLCPYLEVYIKKDAQVYMQELEKEKDLKKTSPKTLKEMEQIRRQLERLMKQNKDIRRRLDLLKGIPGLEINV